MIVSESLSVLLRNLLNLFNQIAPLYYAPSCTHNISNLQNYVVLRLKFSSVRLTLTHVMQIRNAYECLYGWCKKHYTFANNVHVVTD
jgi:hypothetical protein